MRRDTPAMQQHMRDHTKEMECLSPDGQMVRSACRAASVDPFLPLLGTAFRIDHAYTIACEGQVQLCVHDLHCIKRVEASELPEHLSRAARALADGPAAASGRSSKARLSAADALMPQARALRELAGCCGQGPGLGATDMAVVSVRVRAFGFVLPGRSKHVDWGSRLQHAAECIQLFEVRL
jgi:hypothetical protein